MNKKAISIGMQTLVGYDRNAKFPIAKGNCFSMETEDGNGYRIINFGVENLEELLKTRVIAYPIEIYIPDGYDNIAYIADKRIPDDWYWKNFCSGCCPRALWPKEQLDDWNRRIESGEIVESNGMITYNIKPDPEKKLILGWTVYETIGVSVINPSVFLLFAGRRNPPGMF